MKSLRTVLAVSLFAVAASAMADSSVVKTGYAFDQNKLIPTGVRAEVGTTGYGGAILWTASPYVGLALGYNGGDISWSDDLSIDGVKYDTDMDNSVGYLNAEIRPWGASSNRWAQGLYVAAGVGYLDTNYDLDARVGGNNVISIDGKKTNFTSLNGKVSTDNDIAPYVGLGWAPKFNKNWGVFGEVGAYYAGNPNANLVGAGKNVNANDLAILAEHERNIEQDDKYEWLPVGKIGVSYHW